MDKNLKIILYAHKWHYLDNYDPLIERLYKMGIDFDILVSDYRNDVYKKYIEKYGPRLIELYYSRWGKFFVSSFNPIPRFFRHTAKIVFFLHTLKKLFKKNGYKILIASDDRAITHCVVAAAAKSAGLKTILYPSESILLVEAFITDRVPILPPPTLKRKIMSWLSKKIFPVNTIKYKGHEVHRYQSREVLELFFLNIFSPNPWVKGANRMGAIGVNSEFQKDEDCAHGGPREKIVVTGFPPHDMLHSYVQNKRVIQERLARQFNMGRKKLFVIMGTHYNIALYEPHEYPALNEEFNNVIETLFKAVGNEYEFVFKVHPQKITREQKPVIKKHLRSRMIFVKGEYSAYELTAASDAILNFLSSTAIAALATNSPVFSYHLFKKNLNFQMGLHGLQSIIRVSSLAELENALIKTKSDEHFMNLLREQRLRDQRIYGKFDGKNTERFMALLENVLRS